MAPCPRPRACGWSPPALASSRVVPWLHRSRATSRTSLQRSAWSSAFRRTLPPARAPRSKSSSSSYSYAQADRARHAGPADAAVAVRILVEVLLVIVLRVIELGRVDDLRRDRAVARLAELLLVRGSGGLRSGALLGV